MRITNGMLVNHFLSDYNNNMNKTNTAWSQVLTGKQITRVSDNPVKLVAAMNARKMKRTYEQYQDNVTTAHSWVQQAETALMDVQDTLKTIREQVTSASTDSNSNVEREAVAKAVKEFVTHIEQSLNSTLNMKYIFAGYNGTQIPFKRDASGNMTYNGIDLNSALLTDANVVDELGQNFQLEVGVYLKMDVTFTGISITGVGDENMFKILDDLVKDLENGETNAVLGKYIDKVEELRAGVMEKVVTLGARTNKLEMLENRYSQDIINFEQIRGNIEDIDEAEAISHFKMAEAVYQRALAAGARVIQPSLMDYVS
ncbi:MAG: flagellar hook-associated protein FlgL [Clostridia bacterium]|nr:flagellar hook-associated protein FlgL [Clostridia bacterium]